MDTLISHDDTNCAPKLDFLCTKCKVAFAYEYRKPISRTLVDTPLQPLGTLISCSSYGSPASEILLVGSREEANANVEEWIRKNMPRYPG